MLKATILAMLSFLLSMSVLSQPDNFKNPVIPGFHPDPSVCRVGDDYYLVTSSFEWFPGIPIFHSKDLVNWKQLGHVLDRSSQLNMVSTGPSAGIWAPTIRYHEGLYWVVVTCKECENECDCGFNFFVTADDPAGPWSDPVYVKGAPGIDPTIFWDNDGKAYYVGSTHKLWGGRRWHAEDKIYIQELDTKTGETLSDPVYLTSGHATNAKYAEAPHIYRIGDKYLLLVAEGGTWNMHAVTAFEADSVTGPYSPLHSNPVLTHRHLGNRAPITTIGHADLVQTRKGEWWSVMLGVRPIDGNYYLGRETFLTPVEFQGHVPVFNPLKGQVLMEDRRPDLPWTPVEQKTMEDFSSKELDVEWSFLRTPQTKWYSLTEREGWLSMDLRPETVKDIANPSLVARRFQHHHFRVTTCMEFRAKKDNERAGLVAMQNDRFHYRLEVGKEKMQSYIYLYKVFSEDRKVLDERLVARVETAGDLHCLGMEVDGMDIQFLAGKSLENMRPFGPVQDARVLCSNISGGFIGAFVGMYASSNGQESRSAAYFDWFEYLPEE